MQTYADVQAEIKRLTIQAEQLRKDEIKAAISQIRSLMATHGITLKDLDEPRKRTSAAPKGEIQYRDEAAGREWTGRGPTPKWLKDHIAQGKNKEDFRVRPAD